MVRSYFITKQPIYILSSFLTSDLSLSSVQGDQSLTLDNHDLISDSWQVTNGVSLSTESGNNDLVVFVNVVDTTILGDEGSDFLTVLLELDSHGLSDGGVRLLGFDTQFLDNNSLSLRGTLEWLFPLGSNVCLVVVLIVPKLESSLSFELTCCVDTPM